MSRNGRVEEQTVPLLDHFPTTDGSKYKQDDERQQLGRKVWIESKKLWQIVGPAIFSRLASFSMFLITQAFAGHLGDLELAGMSIATSVIIGFVFGLLVRTTTFILQIRD